LVKFWLEQPSGSSFSAEPGKFELLRHTACRKKSVVALSALGSSEAVMKETRIGVPELALVAGTRAVLGAGIGLLLADRFSDDQRSFRVFCVFRGYSCIISAKTKE
jgi:hypothetical protein